MLLRYKRRKEQKVNNFQWVDIQKVISFGCSPWRWYKGVGKRHMNKGRVGEERRGKETDRCPLTGDNLPTPSDCQVVRHWPQLQSQIYTLSTGEEIPRVRPPNR
jgi:hypothetical protein